jgi:hypothetical protein
VSSTIAATYVLLAESDIADKTVDGPTGTWNDVYYTIAIEQPFLDSMRLSLGISVTYSRTPYQSWITYNTIDQYLVLPEFFIGVQL